MPLAPLLCEVLPRAARVIAPADLRLPSRDPYAIPPGGLNTASRRRASVTGSAAQVASPPRPAGTLSPDLSTSPRQVCTSWRVLICMIVLTDDRQRSQRLPGRHRLSSHRSPCMHPCRPMSTHMSHATCCIVSAATPSTMPTVRSRHQ